MSELTTSEEAPLISLQENRRVRIDAKQMYFAGFYVTEICEQLNICPEELGRFVFGSDGTGTSCKCWSYMRLHRPKSSVVTHEAVKPLILKRAESKLLNRIDASLAEMEENDMTFQSTRELADAAKTLETIDKITRLEEGKATQNVAVERRSYSLREMNNDEEDDVEIEEADYSVVRTGEGERADSSSGNRYSPPEYSDDSDRDEGDSRPQAQP